MIRLYPRPNYAPDGTGGGDGGNKGDEGNKGGGQPPAGETPSKADFEKLKQELEDTRMEIMTPEYIEFLNNKSKGSGAPAIKTDEIPLEKQFEGMTPAQIYKKAIDDAKKVASDEAARMKDEFSNQSRESTQKEVAAFARSHSDYEQYRETMYGISLDPKHKDSTIQELYDAAKDKISRIHREPTPEEKARARRAGGEKPGSGSESHVEKGKKFTPEEAAQAAWKEVVGDEGFPST